MVKKSKTQKSRIKKNTRVKLRKQVKRKKKEKSRTVLKGVGKVFLSFFIMTALAFTGKIIEDFLLTSSRFKIREVKFKGLNFIEQGTLEKLSNIKLGENIFQVNLKNIGICLNNHPQVKKAVISRKFPSKMEIEIKEREAIAMVKENRGKYPIDEEKVVLPDSFVSRMLPLIIGIGEGNVEIGKRIETKKLAIAMEILERFSESGLSVSEIDVSKRNPVVRIGEAKVFLEDGKVKDIKFKELKSILKDLRDREEKAEYIDLRFNHTVVKLN